MLLLQVAITTYTSVIRSAQVVFFFNDTATTEIYTLSLHDALPISCRSAPSRSRARRPRARARQRARSRGRSSGPRRRRTRPDRKSTRLNSSHANISYAVFCLKKQQRQEDGEQESPQRR